MERFSKRRPGWYVTVIRSLVFAAMLLPASVPANFTLRMQTDLGALDIEIRDTDAPLPLTVPNFMNYVNDGDYNGTFIHRSAEYTDPAETFYPVGTPFVLQAGGYIMTGAPGTFFGGGVQHIPEDSSIDNEPNLSNLRGTLAMAQSPGDPNSATSEWFINLVDNSAVLDGPPGFTVFGRVLGAGMNIIDAIAALPICPEVAPSFFCSAAYAQEVPIADSSGVFDNSTLINMYIGSDNDGDGAIDELEDLAPNAGDGNNDATLDSLQQHVASIPGGGGSYVVLEVPPATPLQNVNFMDVSFGLANPPVAYSLLELSLSSGLTFNQGYSGFEISGLPAGGATSVTMTLPAGEQPDTYFNYGPTPADPSPHWYEFNYDGVTGAQFSGNLVTLHYVDGLRGDSDLNNINGIIVNPPGGAAVAPEDLDGVAAALEDLAPNNGDGDNDGTLDRLQSNVASLPDIDSNYVTIKSDLPQTIHFVAALAGPDFDPRLQPGNFIPAPISAVNFQNGFFRADVLNINNDGTASITLTLPANAAPDSYFMFGPEQGIPGNHWYEFSYDGTTGAQSNGNVVTLFFKDGERGDADLTVNGIITGPAGGGPATAITNTNIPQDSGGGGCTLTTQAASAWRGGAWWLLLGVLLGLRALAGRRCC